MEKSRQLGAFGYRMRLGAAALLLAAISPAFAAEPQHDAFYFLSQMNKASAVMVVEQGIVPKPMKVAEFKAFVDSERTKFGKIVEQANIKLSN